MSERCSSDHRAPRRVALIGLPETIAEAADRLERLPEAGVESIGAILLEGHDGPERLGRINVLGRTNELDTIHEQRRLDLALICLPCAMSSAIAEVRRRLYALGVAERLVPTMSDILTGRDQRMSPVPTDLDLVSLVGRQPRPMNEPLVRSAITGRRVLITGAGGSIGSELARLCASFDPELLILMERSDNALFEIDRQIRSRFPGVARRALLHDVVDAEGTLRIMFQTPPDLVLHAAAHKHVPMMEDHPAAAVNNNLFGTKAVADAALAVGTERFVMISTDKAVNPSSVMGATKRLAEIYIRSLNMHGRTGFRLVRFGNVLGSVSSVLPIWMNQISEGGPVTVTHPEMTRYFMTIPEAASLVLQAAGLEPSADHPNEVFVLDMGEPIRILDLAERLIRTCGLTAAHDETAGSASEFGPSVRVVFTQPRPGEKLHEELAYQAEELQATEVNGVMAWAGPIPRWQEVMLMIADLSAVRFSYDPGAVLGVLQRHVPTLTASRVTPAISAGAA